MCVYTRARHEGLCPPRLFPCRPAAAQGATGGERALPPTTPEPPCGAARSPQGPRPALAIHTQAESRATKRTRTPGRPPGCKGRSVLCGLEGCGGCPWAGDTGGTAPAPRRDAAPRPQTPAPRGDAALAPQGDTAPAPRGTQPPAPSPGRSVGTVRPPVRLCRRGSFWLRGHDPVCVLFGHSVTVCGP